MSNKDLKSEGLNIVLDNSENIEINFSKFDSFKTSSQEIKNCLITGRYNKNHLIRPANIVLSKMSGFLSSQAKLEYVDFKDSYIEKSSFIETSFDFGAIMNSDFEDTVFEGCSFHNMSITACSFRSVRFINCQLDHMVIEGCKFFDCSFTSCTTSNKLFEFCLFSGTTMDSMDIQKQTITGSFGLNKTSLFQCKIRDKSIAENYIYLDDMDLLNSGNLTKIEKFRVEYYLNPNILMEGEGVFDELFSIESWTESAKIPTTFINSIKLYHDFLLNSYNDEKCTVFPLLRLHSLTGAMVESNLVSDNHMASVYGVHMSLSKFTEQFLSCIYSIVNKLENPMILLVNGPINNEYYLEKLPFLRPGKGLSIDYIKKHNSPNELALLWQSAVDALPVIAVFLATRFKFELSNLTNDIDTQVAEGNDSINIERPTDSNSVAINKRFELSFGLDEENSHLYGLKLKSIFPGQLLLELGLHLSMKKIYETRKVLVRLLSSSETK